jgi:predicted phosphodiesterase
MRIAILSDIHGNLTALDAVLADLRTTAPDEILFGGDLADSGSSPVEVVDRIRDLGWRCVFGNTDEMLVRPNTLDEFAAQSQAPAALWDAIREIAAATRVALGSERLDWLAHLPPRISAGEEGSVGLVHAGPASAWRAPAIDAPENDLVSTFEFLDRQIVAYGHTHLPGIRRLSAAVPRLVLNTGSVGLPYDGDPRASYLLLDENQPNDPLTIRRVEYKIERELELLAACGLPGAAWTAKMLRTSAPAMP